MTTLQHALLEAVPPQPWRNGGGSTRELFTWPGGAAPWQLRLSVADITRDGPFSAFDGVDRWFAVLQGAGVRLALPRGVQTLALHSPPQAFPGEAAPGCWLVDGPTRDLNLMLRRGGGQAHLLAATPGQPWQDAAPLRALFSTTALQLRIDAGPALAVAAWSLVLGTACAHQRWQICHPRDHLPDGARAFWLAFSPAADPG